MDGRNPIDVQFSSAFEVQIDCVSWALEIAKSYIPDLVVFVAKSGFLFAQPLAECFDCEMIDVVVSRPSNGKKDAIAKMIPWLPRPILAMALKSKALYGYHDSNSHRDLILTGRFDGLDISSYKRILVVDDSVDTGWSMLEAVAAVRERASQSADVRVASYCLMAQSESRISVDYYRYKDTIVVTATSRYSNEYHAFLDSYSQWIDGCK